MSFFNNDTEKLSDPKKNSVAAPEAWMVKISLVSVKRTYRTVVFYEVGYAIKLAEIIEL